MTTDGLGLDLRVPDGPVPLANTVVVHLVLANRGDAPVLVNRRLVAEHEVTFEVDGPPGYVNRRLVQVNAGRPGREHFVDLEPGAEFVKASELTSLESMDLPGSYAVRATYTNSSDDPALPGRPWTGTLHSAWATLERA